MLTLSTLCVYGKTRVHRCARAKSSAYFVMQVWIDWETRNSLWTNANKKKPKHYIQCGNAVIPRQWGHEFHRRPAHRCRLGRSIWQIFCWLPWGWRLEACCPLMPKPVQLKRLGEIGFITVRKRSGGKVMFLHLSVILSTGVVSAPVHAGIHPLGRHPTGRHPPTPPGHTPLQPDSPPGRHPPGQTHPQQTATAADGTHPTGMHSYYDWVLFQKCLVKTVLNWFRKKSFE